MRAGRAPQQDVSLPSSATRPSASRPTTASMTDVGTATTSASLAARPIFFDSDEDDEDHDDREEASSDTPPARRRVSDKSARRIYDDAPCAGNTAVAICVHNHADGDGARE